MVRILQGSTEMISTNMVPSKVKLKAKNWATTLQTCIIAGTRLISKMSAVMSLGFSSKRAKSILAEMSTKVIRGSLKLYSTVERRHYSNWLEIDNKVIPPTPEMMS